LYLGQMTATAAQAQAQAQAQVLGDVFGLSAEEQKGLHGSPTKARWPPLCESIRWSTDSASW